MIAHDRLREIARLVEARGSVPTAQLAKRFGISAAQLRRDLDSLERQRVLVRRHGAAVHPTYLFGETSHESRTQRALDAKRRLAKAAVALVPDGASVWVDAGTTCEVAARFLFTRPSVRVITHSVPVLHAAFSARAQVICPGGELRPISGAMVGSEALTAMDELQADYAFLGATAVSTNGAFTTELTEGRMKSRILALARHAVLLADASKWDSSAPVRFAQLDAFSHWVTDDSWPDASRRAAKKLFPTIQFVQ